MVSSTTPRLGPRWPPVLETESTKNARISSASNGIWSADNALRSSGPLIDSSSFTRVDFLPTDSDLRVYDVPRSLDHDLHPFRRVDQLGAAVRGASHAEGASRETQPPDRHLPICRGPGRPQGEPSGG